MFPRPPQALPFSVAAAIAAGLASAGAGSAAAPNYSRDIQPIFAEHCLECHGPDDAKGGLTLTTRESALKALESGAHAIVAGQPGASELLKRMQSTDPDEQMPPPKHRAKKPIKPNEIEVLRAWIADGARFEAHWAYQPVKQPAPPNASALPWSAPGPVDAFVRAKLAAQAISPAPEADRPTLIRRVHYDLLGLPPTLAELDQFLGDPSPDAYEAMLDRALASQHYGERWGRHWLDMARYADSDGYEKDRPRPDAWRYRDWVIRAINEDMPFDQFTIEQLAGDLLPDASPEQIVATAFNRQTLTNTEGGTDQEQFRVEACMDRTETVGAVWLGLTIGCARCHTHKYDQITQKEYFQLFAFFNNGDEVNRQVPRNPQEWALYERQNGREARKLIPLQKALDEAKAALPVSLPVWEKEVQARLAKARQENLTQAFAPAAVAKVASKAGAKFKSLPDGSHLATGKHTKDDSYTIELAPSDRPISAIRIEALPDESLPKQGPGRSTGGNFVLSEVSATSAGTPVLLHSAKADFEQKEYKAAGAIDGNPATGWGIGGAVGKPHTLTLQLAHPLPAGASLRLELAHHYAKSEHCLGRFRVLAASEETEASIVPPEVLRILNEEPRRRNPVVIKALYDWREKTDPDVMSAAAKLLEAESRLPKAPLMDVRVIAQRSKEPRTTHVLHRGDFLQPAEPVEPAALSVLPPLRKSGNQGTRLDLAKWLVSPDHPLTSRVTVNHIWGKLFGEGLVKTSADFGVRGDPPTHPELLDWLASEFMRQGWSRKKLLKTIMMSATYRQSSSPLTALQSGSGKTVARPADELQRIQDHDPRNELLFRQNRLRVEGEIVRDLWLAASGLLAPKVGGPSVFPPMPPEIAALSYAGNFSWTTSKGEDRFRRGLYTFFKRTAPHPELVTFDCPDSNVTNVKRTVSNTPLQALTTLNAEAFNEAAQALARRLLIEAPAADEARLAHAFRLCLSRAPSPTETSALKQLLAEARYHYEASAEEAKTLTGAYTITGTPSAETAAWIATTRIILNMDEFITRE